MVAIINRTPTGRLISLHSELRYLYQRFRNTSFDLKGMKYDSTAKLNPLMFFPLAKKNKIAGIYDPYLQNPLSPAKFHLTQSVQYDSQKSKSTSECLNALEALGWVERVGNLARITECGVKIASIQFESEEFFKMARESVLNYGIFVGFLYKCLKNKLDNGIVNKNKINLGYTDTRENLIEKNKRIPLSTGSQKDTIIRTRSTLFAWAITTGFALPSKFKELPNLQKWHIEVAEEINKKHWGWSKLKLFIPTDLFEHKIIVQRPLSYRWMTKSTKSLRERGQDHIRSASLQAEESVKNWRFAIVYSLGLAAKLRMKLDYSKFVDLLSEHPQIFLASNDNFKSVMNMEKDIGIVAGIPFYEENEIMQPLTEINLDHLKIGAPPSLVSLLDVLVSEVLVK